MILILEQVTIVCGGGGGGGEGEVLDDDEGDDVGVDGESAIEVEVVDGGD